MDDEKRRKLLGIKIQKLRKARDLTQDTFSEMVGIDPSSLSKLENGAFFPSLPNFIKMSEVFGIEPNDLLDVEYLKDDKELEKEMFDIIKSQSSERKQLLYKLIKTFKE